MQDLNPNCVRAEKGRSTVAAATEADQDLETAVTDTIADIIHLCDLEGLDGPRLHLKGVTAYEGDVEDGPRLKPSS